MKKISFYYKGRKFKIDVEECSGLNRVLGLMFRNRNANILFFNFNKQTNLQIHSLFVFFPFIAMWLDDKNKTIEKKLVRPFTLSVKPRKPYRRLLEIPASKKYSKLIKYLLS
jgi:uncharacterized membrane protein (UPF0127 family)